MKKTTNKLSTNLGHNNPPVKIKSIEFINSAIDKLKLDSLNSWNKKFFCNIFSYKVD